MNSRVVDPDGASPGLRVDPRKNGRPQCPDRSFSEALNGPTEKNSCRGLTGEEHQPRDGAQQVTTQQEPCRAEPVRKKADRQLRQQIGQRENRRDETDAFERACHGMHARGQQCHGHADAQHQHGGSQAQDKEKREFWHESTPFGSHAAVPAHGNTGPARIAAAIMEYDETEKGVGIRNRPPLRLGQPCSARPFKQTMATRLQARAAALTGKWRGRNSEERNDRSHLIRTSREAFSCQDIAPEMECKRRELHPAHHRIQKLK
jgi:hypothetical protein